VIIVPIRVGMGARVKFGEALASGAAVVSTGLGAEGFDAESMYVRADEPSAFAQACIDLLRDSERASRIGTRGREFALNRLTWAYTSKPLIRWALSGSG
jgi:glycosyltransferase involved in cell wall biosynthesis